jgi:hypothetical protein
VNEQELQEALKRLAAENAATSPPREIERRVMAAFDEGATLRPRRWWLAPVVVALAATLVLAALSLRRQAPKPAEVAFVAIPYVAPPAPYERTEIRRLDVPIAALMAAGLEVRSTSEIGFVLADVLVGQDGRPLAIRLLKKEKQL